MTTSDDGLAGQPTRAAGRNSLLSRKVVGICIVAVFAVVFVFGGVHYALEIIEASAESGERVPRLAAEPDDDPAVAALKYVCLFH